MPDPRLNPSDAFRPLPDLPGVQVWRPPAPLRILIDSTGATTPYSPEEDRRWTELRAANPRVHDGPILAVSHVEHNTATITCRREQYKRLALQTSPLPPPAGVWLLGVKGWITARDPSGAEHLLIARRGAQTRIYAGLWESAPAGGVDPPRENISELNTASLAETLAIEAEEELGMDLDPRGANVVGVCRDFTAGSDDICIGVELPEPIDPRRTPRCQHGRFGWEYSDAAWLSRADAQAFDSRSTPTMAPPTRAMFRMLGWV